MSTKGGIQERPRVLLLGDFLDGDYLFYKKIFPVVCQSSTQKHLFDNYSPLEIDLLIIGDGFGLYGQHLYETWLEHKHIISFSLSPTAFPGPVRDTQVVIGSQLLTREFAKPQISLLLSRLRDSELHSLDKNGVRDWKELLLRTYGDGGTIIDRDKKARQILSSTSILLNNHNQNPLAAIYVRENKKGVALLPNPIFDKKKWVQAIVNEWAEQDAVSFPTIGNWRDKKEYFVSKELVLVDFIADLELQKDKAVTKFNEQISNAWGELDRLKKENDEKIRRLLTSQGDELVDEVANSLIQLGFKVEKVDEIINPNTPKREDLRISAIINEIEREAIVEVRGYEKSSGKTSDFTRLERFQSLYYKEKGVEPYKKIYIVNGQFELPPYQRQDPFISSGDDLEIFAESNGLVISTLDLFNALKDAEEGRYDSIRDSIMNTTGRWKLI